MDSVRAHRGERLQGSVPKNEDPLASKGVLGLDDLLSEVFAVVADLGPHVVDEERLSEVEFVVRVRHGLEVQSHGSTALDITNLESSSRSVAVNVEELGDFLAILREERVTAALFPLLVEVHNMVGLW